MIKKILLTALTLTLASTFSTDVIAVANSLTCGDLLLTGDHNVSGGGVDLDRDARTVFLPGSVIRGALGNSRLKRVKFFDLDMQGVDFQTADIRGSDFTWSNLKGAKLGRAQVADAHFEKSFGLTAQQKADLKKRGAFVADRDLLPK